MESLVVLLRGGVAVGVVVFDVGDHQNIRPQAQEHTVVLVRFNHKKGTFSGMGVFMQILHHAANHVRRIGAQSIQAPSDHCCSGCFSMRTGHRDDFLPGGQFFEEIHTFEHRDTGLPRGCDFHIIIGYSGGADNDIRTLYISGFVSDLYSRAQRL